MLTAEQRAKLKEIERQQAEAADQLQRSTGLLGLQQQDLAHLEATTLLSANHLPLVDAAGEPEGSGACISIRSVMRRA